MHVLACVCVCVCEHGIDRSPTKQGHYLAVAFTTNVCMLNLNNPEQNRNFKYVLLARAQAMGTRPDIDSRTRCTASL